MRQKLKSTKTIGYFEYNLYKDPKRKGAANSSYGRLQETIENKEYLLDFKMLPCFKLLREIVSKN